MTLYDRYISGETETVYEDIYKLGGDAFDENNFADIEKVLTVTFERVAYNLDIIYKELTNINYLFKTSSPMCLPPSHLPSSEKFRGDTSV